MIRRQIALQSLAQGLRMGVRVNVVNEERLWKGAGLRQKGGEGQG